MVSGESHLVWAFMQCVLTAPIASRRAQKEERVKYYIREGAISHTKGSQIPLFELLSLVFETRDYFF